MPLGARVKVAVPQHENTINVQAGVKKTIRLMEEAAENGARLIAFGELWLPGYPAFLYGGKMNDIYDHVIKYSNNAVEVNGPELAEIQKAAKRLSLITHIGFTEREANSLYMANDGSCHYERVLHGEGGPESAMNVVDTSIGRISVLNCWEHFQPLLKYHTYAERPYIHIAAWPMLHPHGDVEQWAHCNESGVGVTRTVACESGAFVLCCTNTLSEKGMAINRIDTGDVIPDAGHIQPGGGLTAVYAPDGRQISQKISDSEETIIYVELDPDMQPFAGMVQDVVGHYSRPDIFTLHVNARPVPRIVYSQAPGPVSDETTTGQTKKAALANGAH